MKKFSFFLALLSAQAQAAITPLFTDIKPGTQQMVEMQAVGAPIAASSSLVLSAATGPTSAAAAVISAFTNQPDVPRNLTITPTGTTAHVLPCVVTVAGTNFHYRPISENFTFASAQSTASTGMHAFRAITSISWAAACEASPYDVTWNVGVGSAIGLKNCLASTGDFLQSSKNGTHESTLATVTQDASRVSLNTATFNSSLDGASPFTAYFFQNFRCHY